MDLPYHPMLFEKNFRRLSFSSNIIKIPESSKRQHRKEREREREREKGKEKLQESLQLKRGSQYFERRKIFQLQNLFT
jgi:hypothetical protein